MAQTDQFHILPYSKIVGQEDLKLALELAYIAPRIGGVLLSGQRGTGKSTIVRSFSQMVYGKLPITLPINATEDRVIGGWQIDSLIKGDATPQQGLLEEAHKKILYVDEINLLDDHIVNVILDVSAMGVLVVQREGRDEKKEVNFTLIGTMNPEEGELRPQLLDRFGLVVDIQAESNTKIRGQILQTVLNYDEAKAANDPTNHPFIKGGLDEDAKLKAKIEKAKEVLYDVKVPNYILQICIEIASKFEIIGHRGDYVIALAARALAAKEGATQISEDHLFKVVPLAIQHRRSGFPHWTDEDTQLISEILKRE